MKVVFRISVLFVCLLVSIAASAASLCPAGQPVVDGVIGAWEWDGAQVTDFQINVPEGGTAPARLYVMNDGEFLYVALAILRYKQDSSTSFSVILDANDDRIVSAGDDLMGMSHDIYNNKRVVDGVYYTGGLCPKGALCNGSDTDFGGRNDVTGAASFDGTYEMYEMSKPLKAQDASDATMLPGSLIGMSFGFRLFGPDGRYADTDYPANPSIGVWLDYVIRDCGSYM